MHCAYKQKIKHFVLGCDGRHECRKYTLLHCDLTKLSRGRIYRMLIQVVYILCIAQTHTHTRCMRTLVGYRYIYKTWLKQAFHFDESAMRALDAGCLRMFGFCNFMWFPLLWCWCFWPACFFACSFFLSSSSHAFHIECFFLLNLIASYVWYISDDQMKMK